MKKTEPGTMSEPAAIPIARPWYRKWAPAFAVGGFVVLGVVFLVVRAHQTPARASGFSREATSLLMQPSVQKEIQLGADQIQSISELEHQRQSAWAGMQNLPAEARDRKWARECSRVEVQLAVVLDPAQLRRTREIYWQSRGLRAFGDEEVVQALKLTPDQKKEISAAQEEFRRQYRDLFRGANPPGNPQELAKKLEPMRKAAADRALGVLTADQQERWQEMRGDPFKGELPRRVGGPGGGRGGRGGGRRGGRGTSPPI